MSGIKVNVCDLQTLLRVLGVCVTEFAERADLSRQTMYMIFWKQLKPRKRTRDKIRAVLENIMERPLTDWHMKRLIAGRRRNKKPNTISGDISSGQTKTRKTDQDEETPQNKPDAAIIEASP